MLYRTKERKREAVKETKEDNELDQKRERVQIKAKGKELTYRSNSFEGRT